MSLIRDPAPPPLNPTTAIAVVGFFRLPAPERPDTRPFLWYAKKAGSLIVKGPAFSRRKQRRSYREAYRQMKFLQDLEQKELDVDKTFTFNNRQTKAAKKAGHIILRTGSTKGKDLKKDDYARFDYSFPFTMTIRVVRFRLSSGEYETSLTKSWQSEKRNARQNTSTKSTTRQPFSSVSLNCGCMTKVGKTLRWKSNGT